jgi:hypothetical protein
MLDMMLPGRSGFLVWKRSKPASRAAAKPFVIMITGNQGGRHKMYAESLGVSEYFTKPVKMDKLISTAERLGRRDRRRDLSCAQLSITTTGLPVSKRHCRHGAGPFWRHRALARCDGATRAAFPRASRGQHGVSSRGIDRGARVGVTAAHRARRQPPSAVSPRERARVTARTPR